MPTNVPIPPLGDSISQVTLLRWAKAEGETVQVDEPLLEVETDKANQEIPAPVAGKVHHVKQVGDTLNIGDVVAMIDESATAAATSAAAAPAAGATAATAKAADAGEPAKASAATVATAPAAKAPPAESELEDLNPSVRPLLIEHKLDPREIPATGPHGRLLKEDVLKYLESRGGNGKSAEPPAAPAAPPATTTPPATAAKAPTAPVAAPPAKAPPSAAPAGKGSSDLPSPADFNPAGEARVAMSKIRKRTALNLKQAQNTAAILTTFNEVDMSAIMDMRSRLKERFEKTHGVGLGFMSFFSRAVILGLREFPRINAFIDGDDIVYHNHVNLGVAVSSERGLAVPVLKNAQTMSFAKIESEIKRLATAVRENKLSLSELTGGTFTITNGGVFGSLLSTPIINPPQSGILGMHAINKRPVAINDKVEIRPMMYIALSYDHRIVDGKDSVSFLVRLKEYLEDPARLMLEI